MHISLHHVSRRNTVQWTDVQYLADICIWHDTTVVNTRQYVSTLFIESGAMASCCSNTPGHPHLFCAVLLPGTTFLNPKPEEHQNSELPQWDTSYSKSNADKHDLEPSILRPHNSEKRIWNVYGKSATW